MDRTSILRYAHFLSLRTSQQPFYISLTIHRSYTAQPLIRSIINDHFWCNSEHVLIDILQFCLLQRDIFILVRPWFQNNAQQIQDQIRRNLVHHPTMYIHKSHESLHASAEFRITQTTFNCSSVALQLIRVNETGVIAELTVFTLSAVSTFNFFSFSALLLNLIFKLCTLLLYITLCFS